jgi:hypothetical protein
LEFANVSWHALIDSARQVLFSFDSGDSEDLVLACNNLRQIIPSISRLAKAAKLSSTTQSGSEPSVLVAAVAMLISLAGSAVDQQSLASPALGALGSLVQTLYEAPSQSPNGSTDESRVQAGRSLAVLLDQLAKLPNATGKCPLLYQNATHQAGRQQQQRQIRRVLRTHAQPSIVMSAVWIGLNHRLRSLMGKMGRFSPDDSFVDLGASSRSLDTSTLADVSDQILSQTCANMYRRKVGNGKTSTHSWPPLLLVRSTPHKRPVSVNW